MSELSNDLICDIIHRIPVKSLLRFRCVSKNWYALIDSNNFVQQHLSLSNKTKHILIFGDDSMHFVGLYSITDQPVKLVETIRNPQQSKPKLLGVCNGFLCLLYYNLDELVVIWNPATRNHIMVPDIINKDDDDNPYTLVNGFGYDPLSDDYKVVMTRQYYSSDLGLLIRSVTYVYTLRSSSWREIENISDHIIAFKVRPGVLACGALHWVVTDHNSDIESLSLVLALDLVTEEYMIVALPNFPQDEVSSLFVSELGGCLSIVCHYFEVGVADVWMLKDYGVTESWTKLLTFSGAEIIRSINYVIPLAYSESGDEVLLMLNFGKLMWYNLEKKTSKFDDLSGLPMFFYAATYSESLVSLDDRSGND